MPDIPLNQGWYVTVGPVIDDTDFKTLETAITYDETGMAVNLMKTDALGTVSDVITLSDDGQWEWKHAGKGYYSIQVSDIANDTLGELRVIGSATGVLPFESPVYRVVMSDSYYAGHSDTGHIAAQQSDIISTRISDLWDIPRAGHTTAGTFGQVTSGVWAQEVRALTDKALFTLATGQAAQQSDITVELISDLWDVPRAGHTTAATFGLLASDVWVDETRTLTAGTNLNIPTSDQNAKSVISTSLGAFEATVGKYSVGTLILMATESKLTSSDLTVYRSDHTTSHATFTVTSDSTAQPITEIT